MNLADGYYCRKIVSPLTVYVFMCEISLSPFIAVVCSSLLSRELSSKLVLGCGSNVVDHIYNVKGMFLGHAVHFGSGFRITGVLEVQGLI